MRRKCCWCAEAVIFTQDRGGWVHEKTGRAYLTYLDENGKERDHHIAMPDWSDSGALDPKGAHL